LTQGVARRLALPWAIVCRAFSPFNFEHRVEFVSPSWPSVENILPELKTVLPNADFVIEGYVT